LEDPALADYNFYRPSPQQPYETILLPCTAGLIKLPQQQGCCVQPCQTCRASNAADDTLHLSSTMLGCCSC